MNKVIIHNSPKLSKLTIMSMQDEKAREFYAGLIT